MAKTARQLDDEIAESLREQQEHARIQDEIKRLSPREQELILRTQEIGELTTQLESAGLRLVHERDGFIHARGQTYRVKDVLKKHGFRWDGRSKEWTRQYSPEKRVGKIDYLSLYADLVKAI